MASHLQAMERVFDLVLREMGGRGGVCARSGGVVADRGVRASHREGCCVLHEDTDGGPCGAELTHGEKWSESILKAELQDFLVDWVWSVSERGAADGRRFLAKQSNAKDETDIDCDGRWGSGARPWWGRTQQSCFEYDKFKMTSDTQEEMTRTQLGL